MAFIIKDADGGGVQKELKSPLSRAPLDRAIDTLKLAQLGYGESRRAWNLFASESPGLARLVVKAVAKDHEEEAKATRAADEMLARGETATGFVGKAYAVQGRPWEGKKPKAPKTRKPGKAAKAAGGPVVTKAARKAEQGQQAAIEAWFASDLDRTSPNFDPSRFNAAWAIVHGNRG